MTNPFTTPARILGGLLTLAVVVVLLLVFVKPLFESKHRTEKQAEIAKGQGGAALDAGAEAGNTLGNVTSNNVETDAAVAQGQADVRAAPEGQKGQAAVAAACRLKANKNKPQCQRGPDR